MVIMASGIAHGRVRTTTTTTTDGFSFGSRANVVLTCLKQGQVVHNASPGLKVNGIIP